MKKLLILVISISIFFTSCTVKINTDNTGSETEPYVAVDYAQLLEKVEAAIKENEHDGRYVRSTGRIEMAAEKSSAAVAEDSSAGSADYSQTNIQVEGVDEADIVKTDGDYIYMVLNNQLIITDIREPEELKISSVIDFKGDGSYYENPVEIYIDSQNQLMSVIVNGHIQEMGVYTDRRMLYDVGYKQYTGIYVYEIGDREDPVIKETFFQEGYYLNSRRIDSTVYVISSYYSYRMPNREKPGEFFPMTTGDIKGEWSTVPADKISILPDSDPNIQCIISTIKTAEKGTKPGMLALVGASGVVYASRDNLFIANPGYENTTIYKFELADSSVAFKTKGTVPGYIINQFSMDEFDSYFRIATTSVSSKGESQNNLYILDPDLKIYGKTEGLAKGETVKSVRFMGEQAYVVTFRTIDPLFVIDVSRPSSPQVLGELKIPGYSTYLHPYEEGYLLGFGYDVAVENGREYHKGVKVSLFDIRDFYNPKEASTIILGGSGSYSEILHNHKSLLFDKQKNLIAFPAYLTKIEKSPMVQGEMIFNGLVILGMDNKNEIEYRGEISHFERFEGTGLTDNDLLNNPVIRAIYSGSVLYTIGYRDIRASDLNTFELIDGIDLPVY